MSIVMGVPANAVVADVVRRILDVRSIAQPVLPHADLREAGLTSLDMVNLVLAIEAEFDITIPEHEIAPANFHSIASIENLIARLGAWRAKGVDRRCEDVANGRSAASE